MRKYDRRAAEWRRKVSQGSKKLKVEEGPGRERENEKHQGRRKERKNVARNDAIMVEWPSRRERESMDKIQQKSKLPKRNPKNTTTFQWVSIL